MSLASGHFTSRRDTFVFVVCLLLSVGLRLTPPGVQQDLASRIRGTALAPLLALHEQAELLKAARTRYAAVVVQRDSALLAAFTAEALEAENRRLRELVALSDRLPMRHVAAEVLHGAAPTAGFVYLLSAGRNHGIGPAAPVVSPDGLVGVVRSVEASSAVAIGWAHPDFRASAMTRDGLVFGIVAPARGRDPGTTLLELQGVPYDVRLPNGAAIVTSGLGGALGVYPPGIPVGMVAGVAAEQEGWSRTYVVRPAVHPASVSHVLVLTGPALQLGVAFAEGPG